MEAFTPHFSANLLDFAAQTLAFSANCLSSEPMHALREAMNLACAARELY